MDSGVHAAYIRSVMEAKMPQSVRDALADAETVLGVLGDWSVVRDFSPGDFADSMKIRHEALGRRDGIWLTLRAVS